MKILQLITKRQYRGAEVFAANLSDELIKLGHEILFVGLYDNSENVLSVKGAKNLELSHRKKDGISPHLVWKLTRLIGKEKPDVVQCNGSDTLKYMVAASYFSPDVPVLYRNISTISEWLDSPVKKKIYKYLFNHVDFVTSVGTESIMDLRKTFEYPEHKTAVIRRGIPIKEFDPEISGKKLRRDLGLHSSDKIVMHVGNFSPEKNHEFLLSIFSELKITHPNIKLVCIGNGVTFDSIQRKVQEKGLDNTVFLMGFRKNIPELLAASDCLALSSLVEGVPGVILEAGVQKKPSVATNVGGVQEVIRPNETGFIIDDFDQNKFRDAIVELLENESLRSRMGMSAYNLVLKEFNPTRNARRFEKLYVDLAGKKPGSNGGGEHLKILQIIQKKQFRGAELFASQLSNHLLEKGHEVKVYSIYEGDAELPFKNDILSFNRPKRGRHLDFKGWKAVAEVVEDFKPDIVQANASDTLKYTVLSKLVFGWKAPILYRNASISSYYIRNILSKSWNKFLLKHVDRIISVSNRSKEDLNSFFPLTKDKSEVITIGVEETKGSGASPFAPGTINLVHVGSFTAEKNHSGLLRIFKVVLEEFPNSKLHFIGGGPLRNEVARQVVQMDLEESVEFHGELQDPSNFVAHANVLVLPSHIEGLPAVILEAMFLGTPVVAYKVGGVPEVLNRETGFPIGYGKEDGFVEAITDILKERPEKKIENAKSYVQKHFMNKGLVEDFLNVYENVLKSINKPGQN